MNRSDLVRAPFTMLALALVALGAGTCGGGRTVPLDDLAGDLVNAECDFLVACEAVPDRATCLGSIAVDNAQLATLKADVAAGTVVYDGKAADDCIDVYRSLTSCKQTVVGDLGPRLEAACGKVFTGTLPVGGVCFYSEECANQGICDRTSCSSSGCCAGTCLARPTPIPAGGDCSGLLPDQDCVDGTECTADPGGGGTCKAPLPAGARCGPYDRCARPYQCGGTLDPLTNEGTCVAPPGHGQACDITGNCDDARDVCDQTTHVCTSPIAVGGACGTTGVCVSYATCDGTTCVARPGPGATCDSAAVDPCLLSLGCDATMHCALPPTSPSCR